MPRLLVFAGPNGSGKSTVTSGFEIYGDYVNADLIKEYLNCTDLEAAQIAEKTRESLLEQNRDFTFETVLSTPTNIDLMLRARNYGYTIDCVYVLTKNPDINIERVKKRVLHGGHFVPTEKIIKRYIRALKLIPQLFYIVDTLYIFDNSIESEEYGGRLIVGYQNGLLDKYPNDIWSDIEINSLISGEYPDRYIAAN